MKTTLSSLLFAAFACVLLVGCGSKNRQSTENANADQIEAYEKAVSAMEQIDDASGDMDIEEDE